jgi:hypothetical protein
MSVINLRLSVPYGSNSTVTEYLDIVACLCANGGTCNYDQTTDITPHYALAYCNCPDVYNGIFYKKI